MLLLDTHAFIWLASDTKKLSKLAKKEIQNNADKLFISSISALEIGLLEKRKKLKLPLKADEFIEKALNFHKINEIQINKEIAYTSVCLPDIHNDPFDRIIIATAQHYKMKIISKDYLISTYPKANVVW